MFLLLVVDFRCWIPRKMAINCCIPLVGKLKYTATAANTPASSNHKQIHLLSAHLVVVVVVLVALLVWSARVCALLMYARCHRCCKRLTHKPNHRLKANNCEMAMAPLVPLKPVLWGAVNYTCCGDFTKTKSTKLNWNPKKNNNKNQNGSNNNNTWTVTEQQ